LFKENTDQFTQIAFEIEAAKNDEYDGTIIFKVWPLTFASSL
jgi:hypothetical protein